MNGINFGPLEINQESLVTNSYFLNGVPRINTRAIENCPAVPLYPTQWDGSSVVNKMTRVYKTLLDAMPNVFSAEYLPPNPSREFRALPSPQLGLDAVMEIDPNTYTGSYGVGG